MALEGVVWQTKKKFEKKQSENHEPFFVTLTVTVTDLNHGLSEGCRSSRSMLASRPELWDLQVGAHHLGPLH